MADYSCKTFSLTT